MGFSKILTVLLAVSFICGCSSGQDGGKSAKDAADNPPPRTKTVFDPLTQQLDKAKGVQAAVDANTDTTRQAVDRQERGDSTP